jgi:hypothetical protein
MFAHNNEEIDYFKIACANALMVQRNLKVPVSILTDEGTLKWAHNSLGKEFVDRCFEHVIVANRDYVYQQKNPRLFKDTTHTTKNLPFYNCNHWVAYEISPYEETLFIDADYFVMSDTLNNCWGSNNDVMVNHDILDLATLRPLAQQNVDVFGITQYWATVIYFRKSKIAEHLFALMKHIFDNYEYYRSLYLISGTMFRNDHAVSIAVHMLNGFTSSNITIPQLPIGPLIMSFDTDDILDFNGINDVTFFVADHQEPGRFMLLRTKETDVHSMNKWAAMRMSQKIIDIYDGEKNVRAD